MVLSSFYLRRLERFARISHRPDCAALGLEREAREILARVSG